MTTRVIPKTELRDRIREELAQLGEGSLLITERGRPLAVVVSVGRWNELQESVEDLEDALAVLESRSRGDTGRSAEVVFDEIEGQEADVQRSARETG